MTKYHEESKLTTTEYIVKEKCEEAGWDVLRNGWPDFLLFDKKEKKAVFLEVKSLKTGLSKDQKKMHRALKALGINVKTVRIGRYWKPNDEKTQNAIRDALQ